MSRREQPQRLAGGSGRNRKEPMTKKLEQDAERIEDICIETADRYKYIYWLAVAVLHILEWIRRQDES